MLRNKDDAKFYYNQYQAEPTQENLDLLIKYRPQDKYDEINKKGSLEAIRKEQKKGVKKLNESKQNSQTIFSLGIPTIPINKIEKYDPIYPRERISQKTIESYAEALQCGAKFPPVLLQKIYDEDQNEKIINLDGFHRTEAYKIAKEKEIPFEWYNEEILDITTHLMELRIVSIKRNLSHGDRLSNSDKKIMCRKMTEEDIEISITENNFAEIFNVSQKTINNWISDIRARQKGNRDNLVLRLSALGWNQTEIADKLNIAQQTISEITKNSNFTKIGNEWKSGKKPSELAEFYGLDIPMVWNLLLKESDDLEIFERFGKQEYSNTQPKMYDYWSFPKRDTRLGLEYPGMLWGQQVMNILYRFSKQKDLVIDPMAGGGVTLDTCLIMNRKCRVFDIKPCREDIQQRDIILEGFPEDIKQADLILFDPPYYKKKEEEYDCEEFTKDRKTYLLSMKRVIQFCYDKLKEETYLAFIMSNYIDYENELESIFLADYCKIFEAIGLRLVLEIQTPLSSAAQYQAFHVNRAKESDPWKILPISRSWYIFKKIKV